MRRHKHERGRYRMAERLFMLYAAPWLLLVAAAVKTWGFTRCFEIMRRRLPLRPRRGGVAANRHEEARRMAQVVRATNTRLLVLPASCLVRSLVVYGLLRLHGFEPSLRLGVRNLTGAFEAHAWVELDGRVLDEQEDVASLYEAFDPALAEGGST